MNLQFITNADNLHALLLRDSLLLEKTYEEGAHKAVKRVRYFLYNLNTNAKTELNPHSEKYDVFDITDCTGNQDYIYFTEYDDQYDGTFAFNLIKYDYINSDFSIIFSMIDRIENYPYKKQVKIFILNESNILIQQALPRTNLKDNYDGFFDFTLLLFNFENNEKTEVIEENFVQNGIEKIIPINDTLCVVKTGYSLLEDNRYEYLEIDEAAVESVGIISRQQLISDLMLKHSSIVMDSIDRTCYDITIPSVTAYENYVIYSTYEEKSHEETLHFYNIVTKDETTCINKNVTSMSSLAKPYILNGIPYVRLNNSNGIQFFNLLDTKHDIHIDKEKIFNYISDDICILTEEKHSIISGKKSVIEVYKTSDMNVNIHREKGEFRYCLNSGDNYYIFVK